MWGCELSLHCNILSRFDDIIKSFRRVNKSFRRHNISRSVEIISRSDYIISRSDDLISRSDDIKSRSDDLISRSDDLISRGHELLNTISMSLPGFRRMQRKCKYCQLFKAFINTAQKNQMNTILFSIYRSVNHQKFNPRFKATHNDSECCFFCII